MLSARCFDFIRKSPIFCALRDIKSAIAILLKIKKHLLKITMSRKRDLFLLWFCGRDKKSVCSHAQKVLFTFLRAIFRTAVFPVWRSWIYARLYHARYILFRPKRDKN